MITVDKMIAMTSIGVTVYAGFASGAIKRSCEATIPDRRDSIEMAAHFFYVDAHWRDYLCTYVLDSATRLASFLLLVAWFSAAAAPAFGIHAHAHGLNVHRHSHHAHETYEEHRGHDSSITGSQDHAFTPILFAFLQTPPKNSFATKASQLFWEAALLCEPLPLMPLPLLRYADAGHIRDGTILIPRSARHLTLQSPRPPPSNS